MFRLESFCGWDIASRLPTPIANNIIWLPTAGAVYNVCDDDPAGRAEVLQFVQTELFKGSKICPPDPCSSRIEPSDVPGESKSQQGAGCGIFSSHCCYSFCTERLNHLFFVNTT